MSVDEQQQQSATRRRWQFWRRPTTTTPAAGADHVPRFPAVYAVEIAAVAGGLIATIIYAVAGPGTSWTTLSASVMIAVAALGSGGLLGIIFGVPRSGTATGADRQQTAAGAATPVIVANSNLEQISDWLTKILVGVSLTQFVAIKREAGDLFRSLAPALGDGKGTAAFAGSIVIYFVVVGFLSGWLYARLRLGLAMSTADAWLELYRRADRAGDTATAQAAKNAAKSITQLGQATEVTAPEQAGLTDLIGRYEELRATMASGPRRTASMEDLVRKARQLTRTEQFTALDAGRMFASGSEGARIMALALMEGDLGLADVRAVLSAIQTPSSAFEQYHALTVANLLVSSLNTDQRAELEQILSSADTRSRWSGDTSRASLADSILGRLRAFAPGT
jgi:hypothetical protein